MSLQNWAEAREDKYAASSLFTMVSTVKSSLIHQGVLDNKTFDQSVVCVVGREMCMASCIIADQTVT